jgi:RNA polymerase sigma-70 factor (ECF subfamily)
MSGAGMAAVARSDPARLDDVALARRIAAGDSAAVRLLTERNNQRLFRAAWSILGNRAEAEDAVQSAYLSAFASIGAFEGRSSLSTWLTRIAIKLMRGSASAAAPDEALARAELRRLIERAVEALPDAFRLVFVLRDVEGLGVDETAEALGILPATVKTRLLRARRRLRDALAPEVGSALEGAFPFAGADCAGLTERVVCRFELEHPAV